MKKKGESGYYSHNSEDGITRDFSDSQNDIIMWMINQIRKNNSGDSKIFLVSKFLLQIFNFFFQLRVGATVNFKFVFRSFRRNSKL